MLLRTILIASIAAACTAAAPTTPRAPHPPTWQLVFQNDADGKTIGGSREALARALKRGSPIRVAWGEKLPDGRSVVEFAVPDFISLMNDSEVVVQFPVHVLQTSYVDPATAELRTSSPPPTVWRALMATNGRFHQFHYDLKTGEVVRTMAARTHVSWYALVSDDDDRPVPELARVGTFRLESKTP
jgi:hypothetical protein